jgi:hypothetical protein
MSIKLWFILFVLRETFKFIDDHPPPTPSAREDDHESRLLLLFAHRLLSIEEGGEGILRVNLETLVRNAIRSYPYHHTLLFQTLVKAISKTGSVSILYIICYTSFSGDIRSLLSQSRSIWTSDCHGLFFLCHLWKWTGQEEMRGLQEGNKSLLSLDI